jgi:hypothetical protein
MMAYFSADIVLHVIVPLVATLSDSAEAN